MNRIEHALAALKEKNEKALITYITAGLPNYDKTKEIIKAQEKAGTDIIELGIPFSDPVADGPVIQAASYDAILGGANLEKTFTCMQELRAENGLVDAHAAVDLESDLGGRGHVDDDVDALRTLEDVVSKAALAPDVNVLDGSAVGSHGCQVLLHHGGDGALVDRRIEDHHQFVVTHVGSHLLWSLRSRTVRDRRALRMAREGLLDRPRVRTVRLPTLHGWQRLR